jgi:hypothetical protein
MMPEFLAIKDATEALVSQFQNDLTAKIIDVGELECLAAVSTLQTHLVKSIRLIMQSSMIAARDNLDVDKKVHSMMCTYVVPLTIHVPMSLAAFNKLYKETHCLGDNFPPRLVLSDDMIDDNATTPTYTFIMPTVTDDMIKVKNIIEGVFVSAWTHYKTQQNSNKINAQLKKLSLGYFAERETAEAVAAIDKEPAADKQELQSLIRVETKNDNKELRQQFESLKKDFNALVKSSKNESKRGRGRASGKKTNTPTTKMSRQQAKPTSNSKRGNAKVDARSKGSGNGKKTSKLRPGTPQSNRKRSKSNDKKQNSKNSSRRK